MKYSFLSIVLLFAACASTGERKTAPNLPVSQSTGSEREAKSQTNVFSPVFKNLSPLDSKVVSISVVQEDYHNVLFYLAKEAGLNLVIDREAEQVIAPERRLITAELQNFSLRQAIDAITDSLDVGYTISNGILRIQATKEEIFNLSFLLTLRASRFNLGGDVLGGRSGSKSSGGGNSSGSKGSNNSDSSNENNLEVTSSITGLFELSGETTKEANDVYTMIEKSLKNGLVSKDGMFFLDRFTGTLMVRDHPRNLRNVRSFVESLEARYNKQVIIEARIVEVELNKSHEFGVQWQTVLNEELGRKANVSSVTTLFSRIGEEELSSLVDREFFSGMGEEAKAFVARVRAAPYFDAIVRMIESYGNVNIISNPKIRAMHGQPALISAGTSIAYIKSIKREVTNATGTETRQTTVETSSVFDGLIFGVVPYVNPDGSIILQLTPIKSDVIDLLKEPTAISTITLPVVSVRETSTVVKVNPEDIVIIGGIIMDKRKEAKSQVPILGRIPIFGSLFGQKSGEQKKVELIILLRARAMA